MIPPKHNLVLRLLLPLAPKIESSAIKSAKLKLADMKLSPFGKYILPQPDWNRFPFLQPSNDLKSPYFGRAK